MRMKDDNQGLRHKLQVQVEVKKICFKCKGCWDADLCAGY